MILNELYEKQPEGYQDISQDNSQPQQGQLRKTRLTLKQLSKLRQMSDVILHQKHRVFESKSTKFTISE